jgi:hypothetical protein
MPLRHVEDAVLKPAVKKLHQPPAPKWPFFALLAICALLILVM